MTLRATLEFSYYAGLALCLAGIGFMLYRNHLRRYWALGLLLAFHVIEQIIFSLVSTLQPLISRQDLFKIYFFTYWGGFAVTAALGLAILYILLNETLGPFPGLRRFARLFFAALLTLGFAYLLASTSELHVSGIKYMIAAVDYTYRAQSALTVAILAAIVIARKPLGLSRSSQIFGITLGLGLLAVCDLVQSTLNSKLQMSNPMNLVAAVTFCSAAVLWIIYLAQPERDRFVPAGSFLTRWDQRTLG